MATFVTTNGYEVLVDAPDLSLIQRYRWGAHQCGRSGTRYAMTTDHGRRLYLHRYLMGVADPKIEVDHVDGDGLNNRRCNLRVVTHRLNLANQRPQVGRASVYKGVSRNRKNWAAKIKVNGVMRHLGTFPTEEEAARIYDKVAYETWGEHARLNFSLVVT